MPGMHVSSPGCLAGKESDLAKCQALTCCTLLPAEEEPDNKRAAIGQGATPAATVAVPSAAMYPTQPPQAAAYPPQYAVAA